MAHGCAKQIRKSFDPRAEMTIGNPSKETTGLSKPVHSVFLISLSIQSAGVHELAPQSGVGVVLAAPEGGTSQRCRFLDPTHLHAHVVSLEVNGHAVGLQHLHERIGDLLADPLLDRKAASIE